MASRQPGSQEALEALQAKDATVTHIAAQSKFVVAYLLQQDGQNPGWRKANIEGPVYVVRRQQQPWYKLIVKNNQASATLGDLEDFLHPAWELDCQKNYIFYKVEDTSKKIRGLWFHDDNERLKLEKEIETILEEVRKGGAPPSAMMQQEPPRQQPQPSPPSNQQAMGGRGGMSVNVTQQGLSAALHELADDDAFLNTVMSSLSQHQHMGGGAQGW